MRDRTKHQTRKPDLEGKKRTRLKKRTREPRNRKRTREPDLENKLTKKANEKENKT